MRSGFYVTTFNDVPSCARLLAQLAPFELFNLFDCYLSDQSDDEHSAEYVKLAATHGWEYERHENHGATAAKRALVEHAESCGYEFIAQISEDFELTTPETCTAWLPCGLETFIDDSLLLLKHRPELACVHWTFSMGKGNHFGLWSRERKSELRLDRLPGMTLAYALGEVAASNWPFTARVSALASLWKRADEIRPATPRHEDLHRMSGGEWALSLVSLGQAAVLLANPVRHSDRVKPAGSLP